MKYPLNVPLFLLLGDNGITNPDKKIFKILFDQKTISNTSFKKNYKCYLRNDGTRKYKYKKCGLFLCDKKSLNDCIGYAKDALLSIINEKKQDECLYSFLFLCQIYSLDNPGKKFSEFSKILYGEITTNDKGEVSQSDLDLFVDAIKLIAIAADGAAPLNDKDAVKITDKIRKMRAYNQASTGTPSYYDLLIALGDFFYTKHKIDLSIFELIKMTIIDSNVLSLWSGEEQSHFIDGYREFTGEIAAAPKWFFEMELKDTVYCDYIDNLRSEINCLNSAELNYTELYLNKCLGTIDNERKFIDLCANLLKYVYSTLCRNANEKISKELSIVQQRLGALQPVSKLPEEELSARKHLLLESFIQLVAAVLSNWKDIRLSAIYNDIEVKTQISDLINSLDSNPSHILTHYNSVGNLLESSRGCFGYFNEYYANDFIKTISDNNTRDILLANANQYPYIFSLYRHWLSVNKYSVYEKCNISLRGDILCHKICSEYMKTARDNPFDAQQFEVMDNNGNTKQFLLRLATDKDYGGLAKLNFQNFSRKTFVCSPEEELKFGIKNNTIFVIEEKSTENIVTMMIIVNIESAEKLTAMENVYGTASLAKEYNKDVFSPFTIFDSVIVEPQYRGMGFQKLGLILAEYLCKNVQGTFVCATVSPANMPSFRNFRLCDYEKKLTVYYPSRDTENTPNRRYIEPTKYYFEHQNECDTEPISPEIRQFLIENNISEEDYRKELVAVRTFVVKEVV